MATPERTLEELITPITRQEFEASILKVMVAVGYKTANWKPGAVVRAMIVAMSVVLAALSLLITAVCRGGFLELATGKWLDILAYYTYGVTRPEATYATGKVRVRNTGGGVYSEDTGDLRVYGANGQEYVSTEPFSIAASDAYGVFISVKAVAAGRAGGVAPAGTITNFVGSYNGLTVTNPNAFNASDEATDAELRALCRVAVASKSPNGPLDAYEYAAKTAAYDNGDPVGINRVRVVRGTGDGHCTVYVATSSGQVSGTSTDVTTDLGIVQKAVNTKAVPSGMSATVVSAILRSVTVSYKIWIYGSSGLSETDATRLIDKALDDYLNTRKIGGDRLEESDAIGYVFVDKLRSVITSAIPNQAAFHCEIISPIENVNLSQNSVTVSGKHAGVVTIVGD